MPNWRNINLDNYPPRIVDRHMSGHSYDQWNRTAVECFYSGRDCEKCPASRSCGGRLYWGAEEPYACWMPVAVQSFLNRGIKIPLTMQRESLIAGMRGVPDRWHAGKCNSVMV